MSESNNPRIRLIEEVVTLVSEAYLNSNERSRLALVKGLARGKAVGLPVKSLETWKARLEKFGKR